MTKEADALLDHALMSLPAAQVDPRFSERVFAVARANLAKRGTQGGGRARWAGIGLALSRAAIPALLASAAVERTIETITVAEKIYAARDPRPDTPGSATKPPAR